MEGKPVNLKMSEKEKKEIERDRGNNSEETFL